jgi:hypothetical protein
MTGTSKTSCPREQQSHHRRVEVRAVVEDHQGRPIGGDLVVVDEHDVGIRRHQFGTHQRAGPLLDLSATQLDHAFALVEMSDRPPLDGRHRSEPDVGIDGHRVPDEVEQWRIEVAVAVRRAAIETNPVLVRPFLDGVRLVGAPDERAVEFADVGVAVVLPGGADHAVEAEPACERFDECKGRGRGEHQEVAGLAVVGDEQLCEGQDRVCDLHSGSLGRRLDVSERPPG